MKTVKEYMDLPYKMEIVHDPYEGGYVVSFPELPGCLTCGDTLDEALKNAKEAQELWFEVKLECKEEIPEPDYLNDNYSGQFKLRIPKDLHRSLALNAKKEGVSMNQYCMYLLSSNNILYQSNKHFK